MKATLKVELKPFRVPSFVLAKTDGKREEGFKEDPKYPLSDLDPQTLESLCEQFTREVFRKAGKQRPPQCEIGP